jgi:hypothetical protein
MRETDEWTETKSPMRSSLSEDADGSEPIEKYSNATPFCIQSAMHAQEDEHEKREERGEREGAIMQSDQVASDRVQCIDPTTRTIR